MRFRLAGHRLPSSNHFLPNQLAVGCKVMLVCSSPSFVWPSRSSAVLLLQHQKSQQTWAELAPVLETTRSQRSIRKLVKQRLSPSNWKWSFPQTERFQCPTFRRTEEKHASIKSFSGITFGMKNLPLPLHSDQNTLITAILVMLGLWSCYILYPLTILYPFSHYEIKMSVWIYWGQNSPWTLDKLPFQVSTNQHIPLCSQAVVTPLGSKVHRTEETKNCSSNLLPDLCWFKDTEKQNPINSLAPSPHIYSPPVLRTALYFLCKFLWFPLPAISSNTEPFSSQ